MKSILKNSILWFLDTIGVNRLFRWINRDKAIILMYHGICNDEFDLLIGYDERHLPVSVFKKQLDYLSNNGYQFTSMTELINKIVNHEKIGKNVVLTFDDGFLNVINNAYPLMLQFNAKGCYYLVSGLTGEEQLLWTDYVETAIRNINTHSFSFSFRGEDVCYDLGNKQLREATMVDIKTKLRTLSNRERLDHLKQFDSVILSEIPDDFRIASWEQISELDPEMMEIGNHSKSHPNCGNLSSDEELEEEIILSKQELETKAGRKVNHFCYPAGSYNQEVIDKVIRSESKSATTVNSGFVTSDSNLFKLNRMNPDKSFLLFKSRISGSNQIFRLIKKWARG